MSCTLQNIFWKLYGGLYGQTAKEIEGRYFWSVQRPAGEKNYNKITIQEIVDAANIGRTTFYAHFETKDDLLKELCAELFDHIIQSAADSTHTHGPYSEGGAPKSAFCHLFQHLAENGSSILGLLSCESNEIFLRYFKNSLNELVQSQLSDRKYYGQVQLPEGFLVNHISSSFVETILWWVKNGMNQTPEELDRYFQMIIRPIL